MSTCGDCGNCTSCNQVEPLLLSSIDDCDRCSERSLIPYCEEDECEKSLVSGCDKDDCKDKYCEKVTRFTCCMGPADCRYTDVEGEVIWIGGKHTPRTYMERGKRYVWKSVGVTGGLILTASSTGGVGSVPILPDLFTDEYGNICLECTWELPDEFYYQSRTLSNVGGKVFVK